MQTIKLYLVPPMVRVQLITDPTIRTEEKVMYSNPINLYKGINNAVKFTVKNQDQKSSNIADYSLQVRLLDPTTQHIVINKVLTKNDSGNGIASVTFTKDDLQNLQIKDYELGVIAINNSNVSIVTYVDDHYDARVPVHLRGGPVSIPDDPIELIFTAVPLVGNVSQVIDSITTRIGNTLHTVSVDLVGFTGNITAQGSLITSPSESDWAEIINDSLVNFSGTRLINFQGSYARVRLKYTSSAGTLTNGQLRSVLANDPATTDVDYTSNFTFNNLSTAVTVIDTSDVSSVRTVKYIVQATYGTFYQISEILLLHDNVNAYIVEYGVVHTSAEPLITLTGDVALGNMRLKAQAAAGTTTNLVIYKQVLNVE